AAHIDAGLAITLGATRPVTDQAAVGGVSPQPVDRRHGMARCQCNDLLAPVCEEWIGFDQEGGDTLLDERGEGGLEFSVRCWPWRCATRARACALQPQPLSSADRRSEGPG